MARKGENEQGQKNMMYMLYLQVILAFTTVVGWLYGGFYHCSFIPVPESMSGWDIAIYYIRCCVLPFTIVLFFALFAVINKRGSTQALNPLGGKEHLLQLEKNILANTIENGLLFLFITMILATYLDQSEMKLLPLYSSLWVIGRVLFNIGYRISFKYRSYGMLCNIFPCVFFMGLILYFTYSRGFWGVETIGGCTKSQGIKGGKLEL